MGGGGVASCCFPTEEVKTRWIDGRDPGIRRLKEKGVSNGKYQQAKTSSTVYTKCRHRADVGCWCSPSLDRRRKYVLVLLPHFQVKPSRQLHSALVKEHISERKHLSSSSVISYVNLKAVYAQSNKGDRMESDSPSGNAATLPCYGITRCSHSCSLREVSAAPPGCSGGSWRYLFCC